MSLSVEIVALLISMTLGGVAGFLRLEGKVNVLERVLSDHIEAKQRALNDTARHLDRLELKIDRISLTCAAYHHAVPAGLVPPLMDKQES